MDELPPRAELASHRRSRPWLVILLASCGLLGLALLIVARLFLVRAYTVQSNSMAPTLLGSHWVGVCPECGEPAYCSPATAGSSAFEPEGPRMICGKAFHVNRIGQHEPTVGSADRFLVARHLTPRRWDIVAFHYPADPSQLHVTRLVGLPGEEVVIRNGAVWIDGRQTPVPESLRGIVYASQIDVVPMELWGTPQRPARLAADEYFVLGDFSLTSKDSRLWERGAPGHPPYALPASCVEGVATHIYWPPARCGSLRPRETSGT